MKQTTRRWTVRGLALAGALASALAISPVGAAQAATPGVFTLCSGGSFDSYAEFPERGGFTTFVVFQGSCQSFNYGGNGPERVNVYVANNSRYIGSLTYDGRAGANIRTVDGPSFHPF